MKKYLMTGVAALALCAGTTSCSHDDGEEWSQAKEDLAKYNMAFLSLFLLSPCLSSLVTPG